MKRKKISEIEEALFLIDLNNGFCEEGALADPTIKHIVPNIKELIERSISEGIVVRTPRVDKLLSIIDELAPTPNGRKMNITATLRQRIKIEDELRLELIQTKPLEISQQRDNINER